MSLSNKIIFIDGFTGEKSRNILETASGPLTAIMKEMGGEKFPDSLAIFKGEISLDNEITPKYGDNLNLIDDMRGQDFFVIENYQDPFTLIAIAVGVAVAAATFLLLPTINFDQPNTGQAGSPNNSLSARENRPRLNSRVPEIVGRVRSTPDLLAETYTFYENNKEVEHSFMCIGRGSYIIHEDTVLDDTTPITQIVGSSVSVYGPNTSPNSGDLPQVQIGDPISEPIYSVDKIESVNGQEMRAPNSATISGHDLLFSFPNAISGSIENGEILGARFSAGDTINITNAIQSVVSPEQKTIFNNAIIHANGEIDLGQSHSFLVGQNIEIQNTIYLNTANDELINFSFSYEITGISSNSITIDTSVMQSAFDKLNGFSTSAIDVCIITPSTSSSLNLNGQYTITSVSNNEIILSSPITVNPDWGLLENNPITFTATISSLADKWIGPFVVEGQNINKIYANFVGLNGIFWIDTDGNQRFFRVVILIEVTPIDENGVSTGPAQTRTVIVNGSDTDKDGKGATLRINLTNPGNRFKVRARRTTNVLDEEYVNQVVDRIQWKDLFIFSDIEPDHFGDVTTVQSLAIATSGALSLRKRKLNLEVSRVIPSRQADGTYINQPSRNAADILRFLSLDEKIGRLAELNFDEVGVYETITAISNYFGTSQMVEFSYTFDSTSTTYDEMVMAVCTAIHCVPYRQGGLVKIKPEFATNNGVLLFNHRNKIPGTERRNIIFGHTSDADGVKVTWVSPEDGAMVDTVYPETAINPRKYTPIGIRNGLQAYMFARRAWNKIKFGFLNCKFEATQEARILTRSDLVYNSDNTRPETDDGEIVSFDGLNLTLSQEIKKSQIGESGIIFLQLVDGTVESIPCIVVQKKVVRLNFAPRLSLNTSSDTFAKTTYEYVIGADSSDPFLIKSVDLTNKHRCQVNLINYDSRYYANDFDFINNIVDINGEIVF